MAKAGGKKSAAAKAAAVAATATETVGAPATDTMAPPPTDHDEALAKSEGDVRNGQAVVDELVKLREQLEEQTRLRIAAENQTQAVEQRLVMLNDADAQILVAEKIVRQKMEVLTDATEKQKQAKKDFDASVVELRRRVGDRLDGQMSLFDQAALGGEVANGAAPAQQTNGKPKPNRPKPARAATPPAPGTPVAAATTVAPPAAIPDDAREDDKPSMPTPQTVAKPAEDWWMTTALGSVSVPGKSAGEMLSLPPSMVKALAEGGVTNVAQAHEMLTRSIPVKGVSAKGRKDLLNIVTKWVESNGGEADATAPAAGTPAPKPLHNVTNLTRLCGSCQNRWALPSSVLVCPQCNESQLIYDVGYHNNPNADRDGDLVAGQEIVPFTVPETAKAKGLGDYGFCIIMAPDGGGGWVAGYEIKVIDDVAEHHYPNVTDPHLTKAAAMEHGLHLLNQSVLTLFASRDAHEEWLAVASEKTGVKPVDHGANPL